MINESKCPECSKIGTVIEVLTSKTFDFDTGTKIIKCQTGTYPVTECSSCGETFLGPKAVKELHNAVCRAMGLPEDSVLPFPRDLS